VDDHFVPELSKTSEHCYNLPATKEALDSLPPHLDAQFRRLPDGATDTFPYLQSTTRPVVPLSVLSGVDHMVGPFNSQAATNTAQGTAFLAALNTVKVGNVAVLDVGQGALVEKPHQIVRVYTTGGVGGGLHPRTLAHLAEGAEAGLVQVRARSERARRASEHARVKQRGGRARA
jgi:hypothetical protein